ncbi:hypothetical protein NDU88_002962 [Pleurodeles waltl]|uniref:Uncharacterized protein n=1 Tax=Pleurodeles waltl TaxID=8319 RepID=A0AAV7T3Z2_PLEWA|nr:hypothetical protein NDU88_002962 [Pleurodeles waltl]
MCGVSGVPHVEGAELGLLHAPPLHKDAGWLAGAAVPLDPRCWSGGWNLRGWADGMGWIMVLAGGCAAVAG